MGNAAHLVEWGVQVVKKKHKNWAYTLAGLVLLIISAAVLRLYYLNLIPVFADEAIYIRWAQVMRSEPSLRFLPLSDGKQPLFMWVVMPALKFISDPLIAGRVVSVFSGIGTLVGVFTLSYILFKSRKASLLASLLYALSPFAFFFDRMALVDSMLSFFGVWTLIFSILAVKNLRLDFALLAGFSLGGAMLTKSPSIFFLLLLPVSLLFVPTKTKEVLWHKIAKAVGLLAVSALLAYAIYNVLRLGPNFHLIGSRNFDYVHPYARFFESPLDPFLGHMDKILYWFEIMGPISLLLMALLGALGNFKKYKKEVFVLLAWAVIPLLAQAEFAKVLTSRYIFFTLPSIIILASSILKKFKKPPYLYGVYAIVFLFIVQSLLFYLPFFNNPANANWPEREGYLANWTAGTGIREAAAIIKHERDANPSIQIVVGTEGYFGTLPDGLQIYLEKEQNITIIGVGLGIYQIPDQLLEAKKAGNIVYLVFNESRLNFQKSFEEVGLKVIKEFEKAPRDPSSHSYVNDGPVDKLYLFEVI